MFIVGLIYHGYGLVSLVNHWLWMVIVGVMIGYKRLSLNWVCMVIGVYIMVMGGYHWLYKRAL